MTPPAEFLTTVVRTGFRPHVANARLAARVAARPAADLAAGLRANAANPSTPPIVGAPGQLTDLQVHGQDMRRPLGLPRSGGWPGCGSRRPTWTGRTGPGRCWPARPRR